MEGGGGEKGEEKGEEKEEKQQDKQVRAETLRHRVW
jgi:hypothetical protein